MSYWKGLLIACVFDVAWIMGNPSLVTDPEPRAYAQQSNWVLNPDNVGVVYVNKPQTHDVVQLQEIGRLQDSLMVHLQEHPEDVNAMQKVAELYADNGWWDDAIGPLARALQLDPERWSLWSALDRAVEESGMGKVTDAELTQRAAAFVEAVEMWGHGC